MAAVHAPMPDWLLHQIETQQGITYVRGFGKHVSEGRCGTCGARVLRARDDEAQSATVDVYTVGRMGEAWALLDGRATWRLAGHSLLQLWRRHEQNIGSWPIGGKDSSGPVRVVVEHRCRMFIPQAWRES